MNEIHYGGSCSPGCCLRVENLGVRIGSTEILKDIICTSTVGRW